MNHNYYYILLGKKAGGAAAEVGCSSTSRYLRFALGPPNTEVYVGYQGRLEDAQFGLAGGGSLEVWSNTGWPLQEGVSRLFLDEALTQPLITTGDQNWFQIEDQHFLYDPQVQFCWSIVAVPDYIPTPDIISQGDPTVCQTLGGPYVQPIWANSAYWQTATKVTLDQAGTQPFAGANLWYGVEGNSINSGGATIQINNCGQVTGMYAC